MPLLSDFEVYVGATARKDIQLTRDGAAYDLTGLTLTARGAPSRGSALAWTATVTVDDDPTTGLLSVALSPADTAGLSPGSGVWDLWAEVEGEVVPLLVSETYTIQQRIGG